MRYIFIVMMIMSFLDIGQPTEATAQTQKNYLNQ